MNSLKVLIYGEGPTDVGVVRNGEWQEGAIVNLLRKISQSENIQFIPPPPKAEVTKMSSTNKKGMPKHEGHGKIIQKLFLYTKINEIDFDVIVYYGDTDKESGEKNNLLNATRASQKAYKQANDAFSTFEIRGVPVIPLRMLESWLLADKIAFEQTFNVNNIQLPNNPELLWGDKSNPSSDHPKQYLNRVLDNIGKESSREIYCDITNNINLSTMREKCPISFIPFYDIATRLLR